MPTLKILFKHKGDKIRRRIIKNILRIVTRNSICLGCRLCETSCPTNAIRIIRDEMKEGRFIIKLDSNKCTGCLICNNLCPTGVFYEMIAEKILQKIL